MPSPYTRANFILSAAAVSQLPKDEGSEVAIVGRSNAGKSSVINKITGRKQLARVSKTPGRTQLLNVFELDATRRLVDLPGYGFAKVPLAAKLKWEKTVDAYIRTRMSLKGLILVMDIRHPFRELDSVLLEYCLDRQLPVHILLNKADKLSKGAALETLKKLQPLIADTQDLITMQCFSAAKGTGLVTLEAVLHQWYGYAASNG